MEVRLTKEASSTKLQRSSEALAEADEAAFAVVSTGQESSSQYLKLHNDLEFTQGESSVVEGGTASHYFVVHMESSPGNKC